MAAPVTKDQEIELDVESLAYGGNGVARLDGFVVFVRRGLPGDRVRARVTKVKRSHAEALATEVVQAGPLRVDAPCAHYPACGGCRFQDLAYAAQLEQKRRRCVTRSSGLRGSPSRRLRRSSRASPRSSTTATRSSIRSRRAVTVRCSDCIGRDAGTRCSTSRSAGSRRLSVTTCGRGARLGTRGRSRGVLTAGRHRVSPPSGRARRTEHGPGARAARHRARRALRARLLRRRPARVPAGALGALVDQRQAGRGDEPADRAALGRRLDRGGVLRACGSASGRTRSCRRTRRWPRSCTGSHARRRS